MKAITILLITFVLFLGFFFAFQNEFIYSHTLKKITQNYSRDDKGENISLNYIPYQKLDNKNYIRWDASHYYTIKQNFYNQEVSADYIFAFFPLFPLIWRISHLPPIGILFLNFIFFSIGLLLILSFFPNNKKTINLLLYLSLPGFVIFLIPYTEALFFLLIAIGFFGFMKEKYWIYFLGMLLASLTRPAFTILLLSFFFIEVFYFPQMIKSGKIYMQFKRFILNVLPLVLGTLIVSFFQLFYGSNSFFKFIEVQKYWDNIFSIPATLRDWSHEGFGINIGVIFLIFVPLLFYLLFRFYRQIKNPNSSLYKFDKKDYLTILSVIYLIGSTLFIIFFRGGSLHCLFRFTICTPFSLLLLSNINIKLIGANKIFLAVYLILFLVGVYLLKMVPYSQTWHFFNLGYFIISASILLWILKQYSDRVIYRLFILLLLFINIIWTTYLFNSYLANAWIFA